MSTVRDEYTNIVGVDTHARTNTYAILAAATGQVMDTATFPTSAPGAQARHRLDRPAQRSGQDSRGYRRSQFVWIGTDPCTACHSLGYL